MSIRIHRTLRFFGVAAVGLSTVITWMLAAGWAMKRATPAWAVLVFMAVLAVCFWCAIGLAERLFAKLPARCGGCRSRCTVELIPGTAVVYACGTCDEEVVTKWGQPGSAPHHDEVEQARKARAPRAATGNERAPGRAEYSAGEPADRVVNRDPSLEDDEEVEDDDEEFDRSSESRDGADAAGSPIRDVSLPLRPGSRIAFLVLGLLFCGPSVGVALIASDLGQGLMFFLPLLAASTYFALIFLFFALGPGPVVRISTQGLWMVETGLLPWAAVESLRQVGRDVQIRVHPARVPRRPLLFAPHGAMLSVFKPRHSGPLPYASIDSAAVGVEANRLLRMLRTARDAALRG